MFVHGPRTSPVGICISAVWAILSRSDIGFCDCGLAKEISSKQNSENNKMRTFRFWEFQHRAAQAHRHKGKYCYFGGLSILRSCATPRRWHFRSWKPQSIILKERHINFYCCIAKTRGSKQDKLYHQNRYQKPAIYQFPVFSTRQRRRFGFRSATGTFKLLR